MTTYDPTVLASIASGTLPKLGDQIGVDEVVMPESYADSLDMKPADLVGKTVTLHLVKTGKQPSQAELQQAFLQGGTAAVQSLVQVETKDIQLRVRAVSAKSSTSFSATAALFISDTKAAELADYLTAGTSQYRQYISATVIVDKATSPETVKQSILDKGCMP